MAGFCLSGQWSGAALGNHLLCTSLGEFRRRGLEQLRKTEGNDFAKATQQAQGGPWLNIGLLTPGCLLGSA